MKALIRNESGDILLFKVNPDELRGHDGPAYWDLPGGRIHKGESPEEALRREMKEEVGSASSHLTIIESLGMTLSKIRIDPEGLDLGLVLWVWLCDMPGDPTAISSEHTTWNWFAPDEAREKLQFVFPPNITDKVGGLPSLDK